MSKSQKLPEGFDRSFSLRDRPCIGVFGPGYGGKTRFCTTAGQWAKDHETIPGWIICDRKTRSTVEFVCGELGLEPPLMSKRPYISASDALKLANSDDDKVTMTAYTEAFNRLTDDVIALASLSHVDPIVIDSGTELWEWIGYARLGRREGKLGRYWGPSKRDWKDFFGALDHKTVILTLWERSLFKDDKPTGQTGPDGPPHLNYTTTSLVRLRKDQRVKEMSDEDRYQLDLVESIDNKALELTDSLLTGEGITFGNLMSMLRPED